MVKLLHNQIDVVPGRRAQQPTGEGAVGPGSTVLRLTNTTSQENAYTVRLRSEHPYWQDDWYALRALPAVPGVDGAPPSNKADQYGPGNRWVKVYVSRGTTRDILVAFNLPQQPDSRAGNYPFVVVVETHVTGTAEGGGRRGRFTELPAVASVRPFYKWNVDVLPEDGRRVGLLRRSAEMEVVVSNEGNDWLYCDVQLGRPKDLLLSSATVRMAVPPPEPGEKKRERTFPLQACSRLKQLRGDRVSQPLPLNALRVEAPSVAPLSEDAFATAPAYGAVVAVETTDARQVPSERALIYCPPIPSTLTGFLGGIAENGKALLLSIIGLVLALNLAVFMIEQLWHGSIVAEPLSSQAAAGGTLTIGGKYLLGSRVLMGVKGGKDLEAVDAKIAKSGTGASGLAQDLLGKISPNERQFLSVSVPKNFDGKQVRLAVQRVGLLPYLGPMLPKYECKTEVQVGKPAQEEIASAARTGGSFERGATFSIRDTRQQMGGAPGSVQLGGGEAEVVGWRPDVVRARVPFDAPEGTQEVIVTTSDGRIINAGTITVDESRKRAAEEARRREAEERRREEARRREEGARRQEEADARRKEQDEAARQTQEAREAQEEARQAQEELRRREEAARRAREEAGGDAAKQEAARRATEAARRAREEARRRDEAARQERQEAAQEKEEARRKEAARLAAEEARRKEDALRREQARQAEEARRREEAARQNSGRAREMARLREQRDELAARRDALRRELNAEMAEWRKKAAEIDARRDELAQRQEALRQEAGTVDRGDAGAVAAYNRKIQQFEDERRAFNQDVRDVNAAKAQIEAKTRQLGEVAARVRELDEQLR